MKYFIKGILLGVSLSLVNKLCMFIGAYSNTLLIIFSILIYGIVTCAFLLSDNVPNLLLCGFSGLFSMFFFEIFVSIRIVSFFDLYYWFDVDNWLMTYFAGMFGSIAATVIAIILTVKKVKVFDYIIKEGVFMTNESKIKLMLYTLISAIGVSYLVLPENAGISVPIFAVIQFICLWFIVPNKKKLILFLPIFIMSLNSFISANPIWRMSNLLISCILYCCMFTDFKIKTDSFEFITNTLVSIVSSFTYFPLPFKWALELNNEKAPVIKRILIALAIAIPCVIILTLVLANADMVFSLKTEGFITSLSDFVKFNTVFKIIYGVFIGLFLFGAVYNAYTDQLEENSYEPRFKGDLIIINILLVSVLLVYTLFVIVQFKYLFAGNTTLPGGLTYTEYARKGFFELLALTGVNIALILTVIKLTKLHHGKWLAFTKILCHYLCAVTVVLLSSSFYRMMLYTNYDGLTRLRFFVMGFLLFEAIGLLITFVYIAKPKFNIVLIYTVIALVYYSILNIIPADNIIAENQTYKFLNSERTDIEYIFTLSADCAPTMEYLFENTTDENIRADVKRFAEKKTTSCIPERWQRYNLSIRNAKNVLERIEN